MRRIRIVRYEASHAAALQEAAIESAAEVGPWLPWCRPTHTLADAEQYIAWQTELFDRGDEYSFAIESDDGGFLGGCGLNDLDKTNRRANLGYWLRTSVTGHGYATTAVRQLAAWAFASTELVRLEIVIAVENALSQRVAERIGAAREGVLRRRILLHGVHHDAVCYSILRP